MDALLSLVSPIFDFLDHFCSIIILRFTIEPFVIVLRKLIELESFVTIVDFFYSTLFHFDKRDS